MADRSYVSNRKVTLYRDDSTVQVVYERVKATCLWLKGLPKLVPTKVVEGRHPACWLASPGPDRWKIRSRTYEGIAQAMAEQWGREQVAVAV